MQEMENVSRKIRATLKNWGVQSTRSLQDDQQQQWGFVTYAMMDL
ncbi:hypothetical protein V6Z12_D11G391300 [Gossypium hirsutum]|uniref:Uncharacterized protein n=2 Tax=Gossypium TaxID=3633 RepID=A0A5D2IXE4_GOSTO|nr:hypothetical protein ES288_D11G399100v1 [Gossypium darwinii]TYH47338.1 hypothetical protein ES332_D11G404400v1 [Gossypium tomentosum]